MRFKIVAVKEVKNLKKDGSKESFTVFKADSDDEEQYAELSLKIYGDADLNKGDLIQFKQVSKQAKLD